MDYPLPFGDESISVKFPEEAEMAVARPAAATGRGEASLQDLLGHPGVEMFFREAGPLLVIVNDATRPTPTPSILAAIRKPLLEQDARFIVATGTHRPPGAGEWDRLFGTLYPRLKKHILVHDSREEESLIRFGTTPRGNEVKLNRALAEAARILVIGSVEPHYFAGFTGGRKGIFPGIAGYDTITANHRLALDPGAQPMVLEGNPVHEEMDAALDLLPGKEIFGIMAVLDREQRLFSLHPGPIRDSFLEAASEARRVSAVEIDFPADILITCARSPMDIDLYQSHKALENGRAVVAPGGTMILVSSCPEGVGARRFHDLLASSPDPEELMAAIEGQYRLGDHKAERLARLRRDHSVFGVTNMPGEELEKIGIRPFDGIQAAVDAALDKHGRNCRILLIPDGTVTVPVLKNRTGASFRE